MKKIMLIILVLAAGYALNAQIAVAYKVQPVSSDKTYIVPELILTNFQTSYPDATLVTWTPTIGWWNASHKVENNRIVHAYYSTQPYYMEMGRDVNYIVALPVINTYVPENVITAAINSYGATLYSITTIKAANSDEVYQVTLMENGISKTVWMNAESMAFTDINVVRVNNDK